MAKVTITRAEVNGDAVTVTGTVDDVPMTVQVWKSHLDTLPGKPAKIAYVAAQMKAQAPKQPTTIDLTATVTV